MFLRCALVTFAFASIFFSACSSHPSVQQTMVDDRYMVYKAMENEYRNAEEDYLNLLYNIERMPEEEDLWIMKREKMLELMQLKELMLTARTDLDNSIQEWERHMIDLQAQVKQSKLKQFKPNFTGKDAARTSPGQLLPGEVKSRSKYGEM